MVSGTPVATVSYGGTGGGMGYDPVGNRRSRQVTVGTVSAISDYSEHTFDERDLLNPGSDFTYDANGNTTAEAAGATYVYDAENRLVSRTGGGLATIDLAYDPDGNRVKKTVTPVGGGAATVTSYLVEDRNPTGHAQVMEERDGSDATAVTYVYGLDLISQKRSGAISYYGYDGLGSVRYLANTAGNVTDTYTCDAFGIQIAHTGSTGNFYRYTGEQWDEDLGIYYLRARYFNPQTGRFWTTDTAQGNTQDPVSFHKYLYAHCDPVNRIDPSGLADYSVAITYEGDTVLGFSSFYHWLGEFSSSKKISISIQPFENVFSKVQARLDAEGLLVGHDKIIQLTFSGHGSPGHFGNFSWENSSPELDVTDFTVDNINRKNSAQGKLLDFLRPFLDSNSDVDLMACHQALGDEGIALMQRMADRLNVPVSGFDDFIAIWGRGNKWTVYPGGTEPGGKKPAITKPGKPWKGTYSEYLYHIEDYVSDFCPPSLVN